jgi:glycosyltransferase involved in cell wall biosynthesis
MFALGTLRVGARKVDLIDVDHMPYLQIFPLRLVSRVRGIPLVVTWHEWWGREYWREYLGPMGRLASALERVVARCADHLIVDSRETYERLNREGIPAQRMSLLVLGADLDTIDDVEPAPEQWDVLYAGRLLAHKRVDVLIEALALVRDRGRELRCLIVGSGPEEGPLRLKARRLGLDSVVFAGTKRDQRDVWRLMKSSKVFAYPSVREGFGLSILEAQACGTTVVTTGHPDNHGRYLIADGVTGHICDASAHSLADALALALEHPADPAALKVHAQRFSWGPRAEQLREIYLTQARSRHVG